MFLLVLHGRGEGPDAAERLAQALLPDGERLVPSAPHRYASGHAWALRGDEEQHIHHSRALVREWLATARRTHRLAPEETVVAGFSQGAALALDALLTLPAGECPALAISLGGFLFRPMAYDSPPRLAGRRALLAHGTRDQVVAMRRAEQAHARLTALGVHSELKRYDIAHELAPEAMADARDAIARLAREARLRRIVDDVLVGRELHGLSPRVARDLQLAAAAVNHDRFRRLLAQLALLLEV